MRNVDFLITTMDRYHRAEKLIDSIFEYYPEAKVTVADQSKELKPEFYNKWEQKDLRVLPLEFDCGLSKARNLLVRNTSRIYKLILEDDFYFTEKTDIKKMKELLEKGDIVGGAVINNKVEILFNCYFEKRKKTIYQIPDGDVWQKYNGIKYKKTGCVLNFFLAKSEVFDKTIWKDDLKIREHQHFFYRVQNSIVYTNDIEIQHDNKGNHPKYKVLKGRDFFWEIALKDLGATKIKYLTGVCVEIEKDKIVRYKEK